MKQIKTTLLLLLFGLLFFPRAYAQNNLFGEQKTEQALSLDRHYSYVLDNLKKRAVSGNVSFFSFTKSVFENKTLEVTIGNKIYQFILDEQYVRNGEDFTWHGHLSGEQGGSAVFVYLDGELAGNIVIGNKKYAVSPFQKGTIALYEIDDSQFPADHSGLEDGMVPSGSSVMSEADATTCRVRILVAYTNAAKTGANGLGYSDMKLFVQQAIAETNQSFINSQVSHRMELAVAFNISYTESGSYDTDLARLQNSADGYMDNLHTYRSLYGADLCALIFDNSAYCGLAYTIRATSASEGFCLVHYSCALGYFSFGHELGHLYGCRHNPEVDNSTTPFAYGHGFTNSSAGWRTIMGYNGSPSSTRIQYWSNPNVTYGGVAMGDAATRNNARVLNEQDNNVANLVATPATVTIASNGSIGQYDIGDALATTQVILSPGFVSSNGSLFHAYTGACTGGFLKIILNETKEVDQHLADNQMQKGPGTYIFPNPSNGTFYLDIKQENSQQVRISVFNVLGKLVYSKDLGEIKEVLFPLQLEEEHAEGLYLLRIQIGDSVENRQLILTK